MGILKIVNEKLELIGTINDLGMKNNEVEDSLVNPKLSDLGKEIGLEQNDLYEIFFNVINLKKYNSTYLLSNKAIEEFKKDKVIESLSYKLEPTLYNLNTPKIELHPLIDMNKLNLTNSYMFVNDKNVKFLYDNGYNINRNGDNARRYDAVGNNIYEDFSNIKQNEYYFVINENKQIYFSRSIPTNIHSYQLDYFNNTLNIEMLNNFINYTEKQFNFQWNEDKIKAFKVILYEVLKDVKENKYINAHKFPEHLFSGSIKKSMETLGYDNLIKETDQQKNRNEYLKNFIEKPFIELFKSFGNISFKEVLFNPNIEIKSKELVDLNNKCTNFDKDLVENLVKNGSFLNYSMSKTKSYDDNIKYITLNEEKHPNSGENVNVIYCYKQLKDIDYKYTFVTNEQIENKLNELHNDKKTLEEQSSLITSMETKLNENKLTLESFISEYKIEKETKQYNDLMNIFNEKQEPLIQEIEKEKTIFEKIKEKTKEFLGYVKQPTAEAIGFDF